MARRGNGRRRSRDRSGLWVLALGVIVIAGMGLVRFVTAYTAAAVGIACALIAALVGGLYLRHRGLAAARARFLAANAELAKIDRMTGDQFEHLVAQRMIADGFRQVRECGRSGDGGVDITAVAPGLGRCAVQCKRYSKTVGAPEVRNFLGALANTFAGHTGILITSGNLTRPARLEALGARAPLILIERDRLADWMLGTVTLLSSGMPPESGTYSSAGRRMLRRSDDDNQP